MGDQPDDLLRRAEEMERTLHELRQDAAARIIRELRLEVAGRTRANGIASAARALVDDARQHARKRGVSEDELDLDDALWEALASAVDASRANAYQGSEDAA